jgi:uncharacterized membrane protein YphA (DoxX/SURF4 family)
MRPLPDAIGDALLAWVFVNTGHHTLRNPSRAAAIAAPLLDRVHARIPAADPETVVRINAGIQLAAGTMLAIGVGRRLAAVALAASLIPTTLAGHAFWRHTDPPQRTAQRIHFDKNLAILGGLTLLALQSPSAATSRHSEAQR